MSAGIAQEDVEKTKKVADENPMAHPFTCQFRYFDRDYKTPPHLREIMGAVYRGISDLHPNAPKNIARLMPREHGKSKTGTDTCAWGIAKDPNVRILIMSETATQAKNKLRQVRDTAKPLLEKRGIGIEEDNKKSLTLERDKDHDVPTVRAAGFNTGVTGGHYDLLVYDDLVSWKTQRTDSRRRNAWRQASDFFSNLGSEGESVNLVLGTRKHPSDIYSRLQTSIGWDYREFQAISDWSVVENGEYELVCESGDRYDPEKLANIPQHDTVVRVEPTRRVEVLWPERWSLSDLLYAYVASMGEDGEGALIWKRENQNDAQALQGQVLGEDMLTFVSLKHLPDRELSVYAGVDLGIEDDPEKAARNDSDYWSVSVGYHDYVDSTTYLRDVARKRGMSLKKGIGWVQERIKPHAPARTLVESNQAQRWFVQTAQEEGLNFERSESSGNKEERIISMSTRFESGRVKLVERSDSEQREEMWRSYASEWANFPTGDHDDRLDSTEIMLRAVGSNELVGDGMEMSDLPI